MDILGDLALDKRLIWMTAHGKSINFDSLLAAWLNALDTEELNRRFYRELSAWFERAGQEATFPTDQAVTLPPEEHLIRLITRLLFVWFMKEKGLVAGDLFVENQVDQLLKNYDRETGDSYYRTVLQNLFFATLNTEIAQRRFSRKNNADHRNFSVYRYQEAMRDPDALRALFDQTPFINGGLFDCLDSFEGARADGVRIDCFSDVHFHKLSLPNRLFFDDDGLISLFNRYKFTVEENTPVEQEVALDPELLGKVFENLLAAYNPETRETARKQTGSYYTPRVVVDYMVDEALVASLAQKCQPTDGDNEFWQDRLRYLLDYTDAFNDAHELFNADETAGLVRAVAELKVLDPAVGSGAFPMGVLHKLTLALNRLDRKNKRWEELQRERAIRRAAAAFDAPSQQQRDAELDEISETFEKYRDSDFGRKLYLMQNSIFGVDIQPVACQIAKLRFFISLAIEQEPEPAAENFGIKPLPNLETRFIAADTLIGLRLSEAGPLLQDDAVQQKRKDIEAIRERYFLANNRRIKRDLDRREKEHRERLEQVLEDLGAEWASHEQREIDRKVALLRTPEQRRRLREAEERQYRARKQAFDAGLEDACKIARWDPYDQNAKADWFDAEYMFGVDGGFDMVVGNPPYVESRNSLLTPELKEAYRSQISVDWGDTLPRGSDLLIYFYPRAVKFLNQGGSGCFITQNAWLSTDYGRKFQDFSLGRFSFEKIVDTSAKFFSDVNSQNINAVITMFTRKLLDNITYSIADADMTVTPVRTIAAKQEIKWGHAFSMPEFYAHLLEKLRSTSRERSQFSFGQGLNFPMTELNDMEATVPVIVKDSGFVAVSADGMVRERLVTAGRVGKVPALIMPRGIGSRYYCTFNRCKAYSYSHVELYLPAKLWDTDIHYCLWAYLNSSFVWLFREITGRKNLGGGLLKAEAAEMKTLPINFDFDFAAQARQVLNDIQHRQPLPVQEEIYTKEHLFIDELVTGYLGFADKQEAIRKTLVDQTSFRISKAGSS